MSGIAGKTECDEEECGGAGGVGEEARADDDADFEEVERRGNGGSGAGEPFVGDKAGGE